MANNIVDGMKFVGISSIERHSPTRVYDLEVDVDHEFYVNGFLGHNCIAKLHPHGDLSVYDAMMKMAGIKSASGGPNDPWFQRRAPEPCVWGAGNIGSSEKQAAAMRYTEAKLSQYAATMLLDPEYLAVMPMLPNFDDTQQEPMLLPAKVPNVLVNGAFGIAVGVTANIPTFTLESVKKCSALALQGKLTNGLLAKHLEFNFADGGAVSKEDVKAIVDGTATSFMVSAPVKWDGKKLSTNVILPGVKISKMLDLLGHDEKTARVADETGPEGVELVAYPVKLSPFEIDKWVSRVQAKLVAKQHVKINLTVRKIGGSVEFKSVSILDIFEAWAKWRIILEKKVVKNRIARTEAAKRNQEILLLGLLNFAVFEKALKVDDSEAYLVKNIKGLELDEAKYLLDQPMRRFKKMVQSELTSKIKELSAEIKAHKAHLADPVPHIVAELK